MRCYKDSMSLYKRNGKYYCRFQIDGERHHYLCNGANSKAEAEKIENGFKYKVQQRQNGVINLTYKEESTSVTIQKLCNVFIEYSKLNKKSWQQDVYRTEVILKHFKPNKKIREIKPHDIEKFKSVMCTEKRSKITVNRYLENLSKMFNIAVENGWLEKNLINKKTMFQNKNYTVRYLTTDEEKRLYQHLNGVFKDIVTTALQTGLRSHNITHLKWKDIDFSFRLIEITENKGNKHIRLFMNDVMYNLLQKAYKNKTSEYVFVNPKTNKPYVDFRKQWDKAKKQAGIKDLRFHDLRHTVGTRLAEKNVPIPVIKEILAHSSVQTTMRYVHNKSKDVISAMNILNSYN